LWFGRLKKNKRRKGKIMVEEKAKTENMKKEQKENEGRQRMRFNET
jgi:hypothetical protein